MRNVFSLDIQNNIFILMNGRFHIRVVNKLRFFEVVKKAFLSVSSGIVFSCIVNNLLVVCHYVSFPNDHFAKHICKVFAKHIYNVEVKW